MSEEQHLLLYELLILTTSWILLWIALKGIASKTITPWPLILLFLEDTWPHLISTSFYIQAINSSLATVPVWFWSSEKFHHSWLGSKIWQTKNSQKRKQKLFLLHIHHRSKTILKATLAFTQVLRIWNHSHMLDGDSEEHPVCNNWYWDLHTNSAGSSKSRSGCGGGGEDQIG